MPDTLISFVSPVHPAISAVVSEASRNKIEALRCERTAAEQRLEASHEEDDGPLAKAFFAAQDHLVAEPVRTNEDVIQKLEFLAEHELLDDPQTTPAQIVANLIRDFRASPQLSPSLDPIAIHRAADEEVDEIYALQSRMNGGLLTLKQLAETMCKGDAERSQFNFVIDALSDANDELIDANDRLTNAIDPLNPNVLGDGPV